MNEHYWQELKEDLQLGCSQKEHPFHYATLATLGLDRIPRLRTIVLREMNPEDMELLFYTDSRSKKVLHIKENKQVSLLFYNPEKLMQLRIEGIAIQEKDPKIIQQHREGVATNSRKDYTTKAAPGSEIENPDQVEYLDRGDFFTLVRIYPFKIEYLKLKRPTHLRVRYSKIKDGDGWKSEFLVP
ncbi:pyridoxamine 5'-phosphate oxidase family protein [Robiginitalea sp. IMCC44478]|uniref:pyridoxamine 5'-phosphate oxidase family protein n=1 Tax=Robiginitalea sp. IMCC44478 TaxID=3459122 RepID=UPI004042300D